MLEAVFCPFMCLSAVALYQSFSLCPHGVHLLCHLVSVSIQRSGSALGELASLGPGCPLSAASSHDQARAQGPLWQGGAHFVPKNPKIPIPIPKNPKNFGMNWDHPRNSGIFWDGLGSSQKTKFIPKHPKFFKNFGIFWDFLG